MKELNNFRWLYEEEPEENLDGGDAGDGGEPSEPMYPKSELDKAVARRQAALKAKKQAEDKAKALESKLKDMPDPEEHTTLKNQFTELQSQLKELKEAQAEEELKKIEDEKERERAKMEMEFKKERSKFQAEMDKLSQQLDSFHEEKKKHEDTLRRYRRSSLESEILSFAAGKAFNPRQIVTLIGGEFEYDETDDMWYKYTTDKGGKVTTALTVEDYVNAFLSDKDNENLLKADIKRGSDTPRGNRQDRADDGPPSDQTPTDPMYRWAEMSGLSINSKSSAEDKTWLYNTYMRLHGKDKKE